jgi:Predicted Zn peptidase
MRRPQVPGRSWAQVDACARDVLCKVAPECLISIQETPILRIFEGGLRSAYGIGYGVEELPYGTEAYFDPITNEIILDIQVYEGLCAGNPRARFTVAHEIGHGIMHGAYFKEIHSGNRKATVLNRGDIPHYRDPEKQANRFASEFMMPAPSVEKIIKQGGTSHDIMSIFRASFTAAEIKNTNIRKNLGL